MEDKFVRPRPTFPKRAVVTAGMPYGNKMLHFGHVLGMMLQADLYARFLRDRIGKENVIFVSGTDCYGSPMLETYRKKIEGGEYSGSIEELCEENHIKQKKTLDTYEISLNFFGASAFGEAKQEHLQVSNDFFEKMYNAGVLKKMDTLQFYDEEKQIFLNGRQVIGKCPFEGCQSEKAYADECDFCHQYLPQDLINPISALSNKKPVLKPITNWYFDMEKYTDNIKQIFDEKEKDKRNRDFITKEIKEFLKKPEIYIVKKEQIETFNKMKNELPEFELIDEGENKTSFTLRFETLAMREKACEILANYGLRYRNGKTLVPFRITGNIEWGVPCPEKEGLKDLTFYVWPESLWAPISFTKAFLKKDDTMYSKDYKDFWCSNDAVVYQIMGEDNMYFYGPPEMAMWLSMQGKKPNVNIPNGELTIPQMIVNRHTLWMGGKASSSGAVKPPMADDLLTHYSVDELRMHFIGMAVGTTNTNFQPKAYDKDSTEEVDSTLKEYSVLVNVFNRVIRKLSLFINEKMGGKITLAGASDEIKEIAKNTILNFEQKMYEYKFHVTLNFIDKFIRDTNKMFERFVGLEKQGEIEVSKVVCDTLYAIRVAVSLLHPFVPTSILKVKDYFNFNDKVFDWNYIFEDNDTFMENDKIIEPLIDETPFFKNKKR